jgi:hypothetical protein
MQNLPGQPKFADMEVAVGAHIARWSEESAHIEALDGAGSQVHAMLESAGFLCLQKPTRATSLDATQSQYLITWKQRWAHPDCETGFTVELCLLVFFSRAERGVVRLWVRMSDVTGPAVAPGVFGNASFDRSYPLAVPLTFHDFEAWSGFVDEQLKRIQTMDLKTQLRPALAHLEKVSTP